MDFFASYGRVSRRIFWLGILGIFIGMVVVSLLLMWLGLSDVSSATTASSNSFSIALNPLGSLIVAVLAAIPAIPLSIARRHDRGRSGIDVVIVSVVALLTQLLALVGLADNAVVAVFSFAAGIGSLYLLVVLGFLPGDAGTNAYGRSPGELRAEERAKIGSV